jgi:hypothetical protein
VSATFEKVTIPELLFPLGRCVATPGALAALISSCPAPDIVSRAARARGLGLVSLDEKAANGEALKAEELLFSSYALASGQTLWIITEADRSATTLLLPGEY